eukprot:8196-Heterococcus_DN1.PRE.1
MSCPGMTQRKAGGVEQVNPHTTAGIKLGASARPGMCTRNGAYDLHHRLLLFDGCIPSLHARQPPSFMIANPTARCNCFRHCSQQLHALRGPSCDLQWCMACQQLRCAFYTATTLSVICGR